MCPRRVYVGECDIGMSNNEELTLSELSGRCGVPRRTLRSWVSRGWLPQGHKRPGEGNVLYYPRVALERARVLAGLRPKEIARLRCEVLHLAGHTFYARHVEHVVSPSGVHYDLASLEGGEFMVIRRRAQNECQGA